MVRYGKRWCAWSVAAFCAAVPAIAQAAPEDTDEETEEVGEAERAFVEAGAFSSAYFNSSRSSPMKGRVRLAGGSQPSPC